MLGRGGAFHQHRNGCHYGSRSATSKVALDKSRCAHVFHPTHHRFTPKRDSQLGLAIRAVKSLEWRLCHPRGARHLRGAHTGPISGEGFDRFLEQPFERCGLHRCACDRMILIGGSRGPGLPGFSVKPPPLSATCGGHRHLRGAYALGSPPAGGIAT